MATFTVCPPRTASGTRKPRRHAMYGMRETLDTIAAAYQTTKGATKINQATWVYRRSRVNVLVRGK